MWHEEKTLQLKYNDPTSQRLMLVLTWRVEEGEEEVCDLLSCSVCSAVETVESVWERNDQ
jgi:hypothetical protein